MLVVKILWLSLIVLLTSGCAGNTKCVNIPQKCVTPDVEYPKIDNTDCGKDYKCIAEKVLLNYYSLQEYSEKLYNANQVCK